MYVVRDCMHDWVLVPNFSAHNALTELAYCLAPPLLPPAPGIIPADAHDYTCQTQIVTHIPIYFQRLYTSLSCSFFLVFFIYSFSTGPRVNEGTCTWRSWSVIQYEETNCKSPGISRGMRAPTMLDCHRFVPVVTFQTSRTHLAVEI